MEVIQTERRLAQALTQWNAEPRNLEILWKAVGSHGRLLVWRSPQTAAWRMSEKAGLQEGQAVHGLRSERARLAWGHGVQGDGEGEI